MKKREVKRKNATMRWEYINHLGISKRLYQGIPDTFELSDENQFRVVYLYFVVFWSNLDICPPRSRRPGRRELESLEERYKEGLGFSLKSRNEKWCVEDCEGSRDEGTCIGQYGRPR